MKNLLITILIGAGALGMPVNAARTGRVFVDVNKNGQLDKGEKTMSGVLVSDGLHVVKTQSDGTFSLPGHAKERFVFITTPSGYQTDNKHYIPVEEGRESYDFGLQPYHGRIGKDGSHRYIQIADTEIFNTENHEDWINSVRGYANNEKAAFIVHTGDICYEKGLKEHIRLMNTANMNCPVFYCIGNHDLVKGNYGEELFESIYGPVYYSFDVGNVHYIVTPMMSGDYKPSYTTDDVYRWLKNDLAFVPRDKAVVVLSHDLLTNDDDFIYGDSETGQINLNEYNLKAWVYGHWHMNYMKKQGDVYSVCTGTVDKGGIDHSTSVFRVMHVDRKGDFTSRIRYSYLDKSIAIASPGGHGSVVTPSGQIPVTVNAYSSVSLVKEVRYSCFAEGKAVLTHAKMYQATDWTWQAPLSLNTRYAGKEITLKATVAFNNGETAEAETSFLYGNEGLKPELTDDWVNLLGNAAHTGVSASVLTPPLSLAWTKNIGANIYMSSPIIYQGNVYVASVDENLQQEAGVYSLDGVTGKIRWKYPVRNSIKNTIIIEKGILFAQDVQGFLYAIDALNGNLVWEKQLPVEPLPSLIGGLVASDGIVYAGTGKGLSALEAATGNILWQNKDWSGGEGTTSTFSVSKNTLIASSQWRGLYGNDLKSGKLKWHLSDHGIRNRGASAAVHGDLLYITSANSLFIIQPANGNVIVRKEYPFSVDVTSTPLLTDQLIVFGTVDSGLVAVDKETLEYKWNYLTNDALAYTAPYTRKESSTIETSPVLSGNTIYFGASDGAVYGVSKDDGKLVWKHATGAPVFGSVAISGNTLVAVDLGGNVYAFCAPIVEKE